MYVVQGHKFTHPEMTGTIFVGMVSVSTNSLPSRAPTTLLSAPEFDENWVYFLPVRTAGARVKAAQYQRKTDIDLPLTIEQ